jgi:hypothetical protein
MASHIDALFTECGQHSCHNNNHLLPPGVAICTEVCQGIDVLLLPVCFRFESKIST